MPATIPYAFHGSWAGEVLYDENLPNHTPYKCRVELNVNGGTAEYDQPKGMAHGILTIQGSAFRLFERLTGPRDGRYALWTTISIDADGMLVCEWVGVSGRNMPGKKSRAILHRIKS